MDNAITRMLSIHISALLPSTSTELHVSHNAQVAALMGVGLVYQGTAHRHMAEVLLNEIGRPPGPEMENCNARESYSLTAGLALGLVMFGKGSQAVGLTNLSMADTLYHFMVGGHNRPMTNFNRERYRSPSYQIREGDVVNVDVTAPGATLALGMLFFNSGNSAVAEWLTAPDTQFMLDHVRPDFLMLRTLSKDLVMWDSILPSAPWIRSHLPEIVKKYAFKRGEGLDEDDNGAIDYETISQAHCNITAGACMSMGLKFAGSANEEAFNTLMSVIEVVFQLTSNPAVMEQVGHSTVENCFNVMLLSLAMVMAGTGSLEVLRICRMLRKRVSLQFNQTSMYGSHMATAMAIGLLFLGGGRYTLSTKPEAIGVMLCAFFPKFPVNSTNNRYHLQAFRHLYVLAAEPRLIYPRDVDTGRPCYVPVEVKFKDCGAYRDAAYQIFAPCLLPELDLLQEVKILDSRYWPIVFHADKNWDVLRNMLQKSGSLYVKQRAGHLSYAEDPKGYRSLLAKSLTHDQACHSAVKPDVIKSFTSDPKLLCLTECFLSSKIDQDFMRIQRLSAVIYECVTQEKPEAISTHLSLEKMAGRLDPLDVWQAKLCFAYYHSSVCLAHDSDGQAWLLQPEFLLALKNNVEYRLESWQQEHSNVLLKYLKGDSLKEEETHDLSAFVSWFDLPSFNELSKIVIEGTPTLPALCTMLPNLRTATIMKLLSAWQATKVT